MPQQTTIPILTPTEALTLLSIGLLAILVGLALAWRYGNLHEPHGPVIWVLVLSGAILVVFPTFGFLMGHIRP
jgi:uncharacterized membrane protein